MNVSFIESSDIMVFTAGAHGICILCVVKFILVYNKLNSFLK